MCNNINYIINNKANLENVGPFWAVCVIVRKSLKSLSSNIAFLNITTKFRPKKIPRLIVCGLC